MTEQEKEGAKNTLRIVLNTIQLLTAEGIFNGRHAIPILEGTQFLQGVAKELEKRLAESSLILPAKELVVAGAGDVPIKS